MTEIRIGISGWRYGPWRGVFYPENLAQAQELFFASRQMNSIEINGSFYALQHPSSYTKWYEATPDDFKFSVKGGRFITHIKRLKEIETPLSNFFASGLFCLGEKLGPILWQLPPSFQYDGDRIENFFKQLPRDTVEAAKLAKKHDARMKGRVVIRPTHHQEIKYALEVRNESFRTEEFVKLLRKYSIAFVFADSAGKWPYFEDLTSDFCYLRLHGAEKLYASGYDEDSLNWWARRIRIWSSGSEPEDRVCVSPRKAKKKKRDIYVFFDNDIKVRAPFDAIQLLRKVTSFVPAHPPMHAPRIERAG